MKTDVLFEVLKSRESSMKILNFVKTENRKTIKAYKNMKLKQIIKLTEGFEFDSTLFKRINWIDFYKKGSKVMFHMVIYDTVKLYDIYKEKLKEKESE